MQSQKIICPKCGTEIELSEAIVEAFVSMKEGLDKEKAAAMKNWAVREMQLGRVIKNTVGMYGDMQGIIGATLPKIDYLELEVNTSEGNIISNLKELE